MNDIDNCTLLVSVLREPEKVSLLSLSQWDLLLRHARESRLLSRLAYELYQHNDLVNIPEKVKMHLESAITFAERQQQVVKWEVRCVTEALHELDVPVVILKGGAYVMADLPAAQGRVFSDIDILVPKGDIEAVEQGLFAAGWVTTHLDKYDQRYYRQWMHELPPMQHHQRKSVLDVHHNILPETAKAKPDAQLLLADIKPLDKAKNLYVLSPVDMIVHSATHLFYDGEFNHGLRDLHDMHDLICAFKAEENFWQQLLVRASQLGLGRPVFYALKHVKRLYHTDVPDDVLQRMEQGAANGIVLLLMNRIFSFALRPPHSSCRTIASALARQFLYIRAHYLRMPIHLLLPHLIRKALRSDDS